MLKNLTILKKSSILKKSENDAGIGNPAWFQPGNRFPENPVPCLQERAVVNLTLFGPSYFDFDSVPFPVDCSKFDSVFHAVALRLLT